jgi:uncharacterized protein YndB with AHSA1/START domain
MKIRTTVEIAAPIERVWPLIGDDKNIPLWMPEIVETRYGDEHDRMKPVGARFTQKIKEGGRIKEYAGLVTAFEQGRLLGIRLSDKHFDVDVLYKLSEHGRSTRLDYSCEMALHGWVARIMSVLARPLTRRILGRHMASLKRVAESDSPLS